MSRTNKWTKGCIFAHVDGEKVRPFKRYQKKRFWMGPSKETTGTFQLITTKKEEMAEKVTEVWEPTSDVDLQAQPTSDVDLQAQLDMVDSRIKKEPNNRDLWRKRRMIVGNHGTIAAANKLRLTKEILLMDAKNKYAWSHRQWVFLTCGGGENELAFRDELLKDVEFCDGVLKDNIYNGFAWDQRLLSVTRIGGDFVVEVDDSVKFILNNPDNDYPWVYLRGIYCKGIEAGGRVFKDKVCAKLDDLFIEIFCTKESPCGGSEAQEVVRYEVCVYDMKYVHAFDKFLDLACLGYEPSWTVIDAMDGLQSRPLRLPDFSHKYAGYTIFLQLSRVRDIALPFFEHLCPMRMNEWKCRIEQALNSAVTYND